ncbi:amino acid transporter [Aureobasidium pullulans]|nr:amino acid transporter [Aureobasidium pullulans]
MVFSSSKKAQEAEVKDPSAFVDHETASDDGHDVYQTSEGRRQIGLVSAIFLIFNRMIGTGIFATPSSILSSSGSVGLALFIWVAGLIIAAAGMAVYLEFGTALPRNGGEKNYLEHVFKKPKFLVTGLYFHSSKCTMILRKMTNFSTRGGQNIFRLHLTNSLQTGYVVLLGWAGSNSVVFGEYILNAAQVPVNRWNQRGIGLACITSAFLIHGLALKWGLRLQNILGVIKLIILLIIVFAGFAALGGHLRIEKPNNFDNAFEGTTGSAYGVVTALYNVIWSFIGYSNANYSMSEMKNPVRTLKIAAPTAIMIVGVLYLLANVAYFAAVPKEDIVSSGRILAAQFFRNVFGLRAERALSVFVALSAYGNVLSVIFSQGRLVQELGREGILPFSRLWASNKPFNAPFMGLFEHWAVSVIIMLAPPPGDAYNFVLNVISYPLSVVNVFVSIALIWIYTHKEEFQWNPPVKATLPVAIFFFLSNVYLVIAPFVPPPTPEQNQYTSLPYYLHCVVGLAIIAAGGIYWLFWAVLLPKIGGYRLEKEVHKDAEGWTRNVFIKVPNHQAPIEGSSF